MAVVKAHFADRGNATIRSLSEALRTAPAEGVATRPRVVVQSDGPCSANVLDTRCVPTHGAVLAPFHAPGPF